MERILITGASGFLGGALVSRLVREGRDVIATGRDTARLGRLPACAIVPVDLTAPCSLDIDVTNVGVIVHCAALSSAWGRRDAFETANIKATDTCIELARRTGAHLIQISTPAVYFRFKDQIDIPETLALPHPVNDYARTKRIAEENVSKSGVTYTILRPRGIYGAGDTALLPRLLRAARTGPLPRFRGGTAVTDITHVDDVVEAILAVLNNRKEAARETFNISGGDARRIIDIAEAVCAGHDVPLRWRDLPLTPALAAVRMAEVLARLRPGQPEPRVTVYGLGIFAFSQTLDLMHARSTIGWSPRIGFEEGLARTLGVTRA